MFCRHCGATIPDDSVFCPKCGKEQAVDQEPSRQTWEEREQEKQLQEKAERKRKLKVILLMLLAGVIILFIAILTIPNPAKTTKKTVNNTEKASNVTESAKEDQHNTVFRDTYWGMSKAEVKEIADGRLGRSGNNELDYYSCSYNGFDSRIAYLFTNDDELCGVIVVLDESHTTGSLFISDYDSIRSKLTNKYGDPTIDREDWVYDLYSTMLDKGQALQVGFLSYYTKYMVDRETKIEMEMYGDNMEVKTYIIYKSRKLYDKYEKAREANSDV